MKLKATLFSLAIIIAALRVVIVPRLTSIPTWEGSYEALAHILVGFLIIVPLYDPKNVLGPSRFYGWIGWGLAFWEAGWFAWQRMHV